MRNPITKLAAAAVVAIACVVGVSLWKGTSSGVTLADVLEELEQVTTYRYQTRTTLTRPQGREERFAAVLVSRDQGIRIDARSTDPNTAKTRISETDYVLPEQDCILFLSHDRKAYVRLKFQEPAELEQYKGENNDPRTIVRGLLNCEHVRLGQSVIDGITVEGFRTTDPNYEDGFLKISDWMGSNEEVDVTLWVDVKTRLPMRLVEDIVKKSGSRFHEVTDDFRWNVPVTGEDFPPVIPEDYISIGGDGLILPASNEEATIEGLRFFRDRADAYPRSLDTWGPECDTVLGAELDEAGKPAWDKYSEDEANRISRDMATIGAPGMFFRELSDDQKEPAYYGDTVRPGEAEKVLLRWKLDDGQYRVIFGDLSVRTVTAKELAGLESL